MPRYLSSATSMDSAERMISSQLDHVLTKFNKIGFIFQDSETYEIKKYFQFIPDVVARKNNFLLNQTLDQPRNPKFQIMIGWDITTDQNMFESYASYIRDISDKTNLKCANSVQTVVVYCLSDLVNVTLLQPRIQLAKRIFSSTPFNYTMAGIFQYNHCTDENSLKSLLPLISQLDEVYFQHFWTYGPEGILLPNAGYTTARAAIGAYERCKTFLKSENLFFNVGFATTFWCSEMGRELYGDHYIVTFWKELSTWAANSNSNVLIHEAFDKPGSTKDYDHAGWWRVIKTSSDTELEKLIYYEKSPDMPSIISTTLEPFRTTSGTSFFNNKDEVAKITIYATTALSLTIAFAVVVMYVTYKKVLSNVKTLTKSEIHEFFQGSTQYSQILIQNSYNHIVAYPASLPYDEVKYELSVGSFIVEKNNVLGEGAYGTVFSGFVFKDGNTFPAAVKTLKSKSSVSAKRALLSEIKVLSYVGTHQNILKLLGAYTKQLKKGEILAFTELCSMGSLYAYLRKHIKTHNSVASTSTGDINTDGYSTDSRLQSFGRTTDPDETNTSESGSFMKHGSNFESDMILWSVEIANGMEFLASRHVVHADLATRNVLLTKALTAKISDFGLSRRLYHIQEYVKKQSDYLPWRWMAPESLRRFVFTEKTDVWAYGVTLWEIFSFGNIPYPGLAYNENFLLEIENGLRPSEPLLNISNIYTLLLECWNINPDNRPSFTAVKSCILKRFPVYLTSSENEQEFEEPYVQLV